MIAIAPGCPHNSPRSNDNKHRHDPRPAFFAPWQDRGAPSTCLTMNVDMHRQANVRLVTASTLHNNSIRLFTDHF
jgi:hypothetical protein